MTTEQATRQEKPRDELSPAEVLAAVRDSKSAENRAAAEQLELAAFWADLHPAPSEADAPVFLLPGLENEVQIAGEACPLAAEFCIAEFGTSLGISTTAAMKLIGNALELRHRLPKLYSAVLAGRVPARRARLVAEATTHASPGAADGRRPLGRRPGRPVYRQGRPDPVDRPVAEAIEKFVQTTLPEDPEDPDPPSPDRRHVIVDKNNVSYNGTLRIEGELDLPDALDLDQGHPAGRRRAQGPRLHRFSGLPSCAARTAVRRSSRRHGRSSTRTRPPCSGARPRR